MVGPLAARHATQAEQLRSVRSHCRSSAAAVARRGVAFRIADVHGLSSQLGFFPADETVMPAAAAGRCMAVRSPALAVGPTALPVGSRAGDSGLRPSVSQAEH